MEAMRLIWYCVGCLEEAKKLSTLWVFMKEEVCSLE